MEKETEYRDINWSVNFKVNVNGVHTNWDDLTDSEKNYILNCIKDDYYSGTFLNQEDID